MAITSQHITGFVLGVGAAAAGYLLYKQNQAKVDAFLKERGIELPTGSAEADTNSMSLKELVQQKERFEDLIAEREFAEKQKDSESAAAKKKTAKA
jgi:hypothetical protein